MDEKPTKPEVLNYVPIRQSDGGAIIVSFLYLVGSAMILGAAGVVWISLTKYSKAEFQSDNLRQYLEADARRYLLVAAIMTVVGFIMYFRERTRTRLDSKNVVAGFSVLYAGVALSYFGEDFGHIGPLIAMIGVAIAMVGGMVLLRGLAAPLFRQDEAIGDDAAQAGKH